mmetsp:Transcript_618/g.1591  ORF Transcript_618/g.1591 Transcript_618/m.1591 type:complete len:551 (-) Transcript_618:70-1722(-)
MSATVMTGDNGQQSQRQVNRSNGRTTSSATAKQTATSTKIREGRSSSRHSGGILYLFLCVLLVGAFLSFHRSSRVLSNSNIIGLESVLNDFKKGGNTNLRRQTKPLTHTSENNNDDVSEIDQPETPLPNPRVLADGNKTFSSCLLVMDDNHRLAEFLAYHYHVLPLRYLIIAVDPRSKTSPTKVLNRYRRIGMFVEEWNDFKFLSHDLASKQIPDDAVLQVKRDRHRVRQKNFYRQCLMRMKAQRRTWVTLIDTDEFIMYNHKSSGVLDENGQDVVFEEWEKRQLQKHAELSNHPNNKHRVRPSKPPPSPYEEGGLIRYLHQEQAAGNPFFSNPCISCPRLQFGAKESSEEERRKGVPTSEDSDNPIIDPARLDTLRFRKHSERQDFVKNGLSKSILDVSRIENFPRIESLHRPLKKFCPAPWRDEWDSGLRINHYLGSWEQYSFRDDSRRGGERSVEGWAFKAKDADETDDNIRPWVEGFAEKHGPKEARELLKGAGLPPGYDTGNGKNWTIMFLDEILSANETKGNDIRKSFDSFVRDFHLNKNEKLD